MGNGPVGGDGLTKLTYSIENVKKDEICQNEDVVALAEGRELKSVFFSDNGVGLRIQFEIIHQVLIIFLGPVHI